MRKIALAAATAIIISLFSGCALTGGTAFLFASALTLAGIALLIFGVTRVLQRRKTLHRSRRVSQRGLKKADRLTLAVFATATAMLLLGLLLLAVNLGPMLAADNETPEITPEPTYEERELPWKTFPPDQPIASKEYFVYSCNTDEYLRSTIDDTVAFSPTEFTTLFTAYVATKYIKPALNFRVTEEALMLVPEGAKTAGFIADQTTTAKLLVEALIVTDAVDAAYILAYTVGSSLLDDPATAEVEEIEPTVAVARFVQEMNATAKELGMTSTTFVNIDGSKAEGQKTTVADLLIMSKALFKVETIMEFMATGKDTITLSNTASFVWENNNKLVDKDNEFYCPYATGVKMARAKDGGHILISSFESNGKRLIIGVLNEKDTDQMYTDVLHLFNLTMGVY